MNLRQIEVFKAVMSTGSVSDASRLLHVSVPAVSRVLSHTETQLGFPLFERIKGRLHPTPEARLLFAEVELVYRGVQRVERLTQEIAERRRGLLSVVASPSIGQMIVPQALSHFRVNHPTVRVKFECLSYELLKDSLLHKQVDVGIAILPVDHPNLRTIPVAISQVVCVCLPGHPLAELAMVGPRDLLDQRLIHYPSHTPFGIKIAQWFEKAGISPDVLMQVGSPQNACPSVLAGNGVALVDEFSLSGTPKGALVSIPVRDIEPIVADLVYLRTTPLTPLAEGFIRSLRSVLLQRNLAVKNAP
ncbi:LysR substrate-binding domain-containing protein [Variovorax sp. J31P207]|uniref:LysR family transcriptional regulator n=1 Tax=Variovorax sp. J31P207 TaxID=3053510 RepID=UPI0025756566|nr:LysR substrate-binding domain-containing protein [Variovorax sp. J31P207]MDM0071567.1 LysR substrate-binding domain-containing protein [Variovorax sp. J31P207]